MQRGHGGMGTAPPTYEESMKKMERFDVDTVAQMCRRGQCHLHVTPTSNGFVVSINGEGVQEDLVYTRPEYVGRLVQSIFNSNLENEGVLKRLRKLMGYL